MSSDGIFVSIDGPGGVGKSTAARLICEQLTAQGRQVCLTAEPSRTPLGEMIRASTDTYCGIALACLVAGDRHHHLATEIRPQLHAGAIVISDRYLPSSLVLQRMDGVDQDTIWQLNSGAEARTWPLSSTPRQRSSPPGWPSATAPTAASSASLTVLPPNPPSIRTPPLSSLPSAGQSAAST